MENKKIYIHPEIKKVELDKQISLAMISPVAPPADPFASKNSVNKESKERV